MVKGPAGVARRSFFVNARRTVAQPEFPQIPALCAPSGEVAITALHHSVTFRARLENLSCAAKLLCASQ